MRLSTETFKILATHFDEYSDQFYYFQSFRSWMILRSRALWRPRKESIEFQSLLRGNAMGTFQAEVGLWQILARQRQIPR